MSPPVGVTSSKMRSSPRIGRKWTTRIMMNVVTTSVDTVTARRTTRSSGQGRLNHWYGRRMIRIPTRDGSDRFRRSTGGVAPRRRGRRRRRGLAVPLELVPVRRRRRRRRPSRSRSGPELAVELRGEVVAFRVDRAGIASTVSQVTHERQSLRSPATQAARHPGGAALAERSARRSDAGTGTVCQPIRSNAAPVVSRGRAAGR